LTSAERLGRGAFVVLIVGLALHNAAMAQLWDLGIRGELLDAIAAWKEMLLLGVVVGLGWALRERVAISAVDVLAATYALVVVAYAVIPQDWLGGEATARGELLALRHHLLPVGGYAIGRLLGTLHRDTSWLGVAAVLTAAGVTVLGLVDVGLVGLQAWRESGVPSWYGDQLGLEYRGLSGLPENWVYNTGDEENPIRRLVSTFLSPLASAYAIVVALIFVVSRPLRWWWALVAALLYVGLLYTHTRAALAALAVGLVILALVQRRLAPAVLGVASVAAAAVFLVAYPSLGPTTSYTPEELEFLRENAQREPGESTDPFSPAESSVSSHWQNLRDGVEAVLEHPQGYGLANAGVVAKRTDVQIRAGESTYAELGIDAGVVGLAAFVLWSLALLVAVARREPWVAAAFVAVLLLGLQTDVIGIHWLAAALWGAAGIAVSRPRPLVEPEPPPPIAAAPTAGERPPVEQDD
jgi:O-Antigen ligase